MYGAIIGDIVGSRFEFNNLKSTDFELFAPQCDFTDDTICTVAVADWLLDGGDLAGIMQTWCRRYPNPKGAYGGGFRRWLWSANPQPYNSWGNGSAMRVSAVGWLCHSEAEVLEKAEESASITHNHPEGIKGAQAVALAIYLARKSASKQEIKNEIMRRFAYNLSQTCDEIRPNYQFNESCQETVPQAIVAFLDSNSFEEALRLAVSLGGDSDTLTAITASIAEAYYGDISPFIREAKRYLDLDMIKILNRI